MNDVITRNAAPVQTVNKVEFVGSVVHKYRPNNNLITLTLAIGRPDGETVDYPNITFYGDNAGIIDKAINVKADDYPRICISAEIQTSRKVRDGKRIFYQNIVGKELRKAPTNMERLTGQMAMGSHKLAAVNEVCLMGEVVNIYEIPSKDRERTVCTILTIKTTDGGRINFPKVTCYGSNSATAAELQSGNTVCVTARVQTRYIAETKTRFETVVCSELMKVDA